MRQAEQRGLRRLALVGTGCQAAMNKIPPARRVNKHPADHWAVVLQDPPKGVL
jgi:coenzyme F420-reducing hydrogenase beta subunit